MLKEIHEQPVSLVDTLNSLLDRAKTDPFPLALQPGVEILSKAQKLTLVACGTSWHAALIGKYWIEHWAKIPVDVELASEFRYREPVLGKGDAVVGISQSGETADTLAVLRELKSKGIPTLGITNVRGSSISRETDGVFYMAAGPEIGVAATKTFLTQMTTLLLFAGHLARVRKVRSAAEIEQLFEGLVKLPHLLTELLGNQGGLSSITQEVAKKLHEAGIRGYFYIGRGLSFPIALEGALKLKEIAYVHAEGYAAGELKHGPIAMIDSDMAVVVLAPNDLWHDKTLSNLEEVKARGARIVAIGEEGDNSLRSLADDWIPVPTHGLHNALTPFLMTPAIQLLGYHLAVLRGTDVDKPRNLAKSVTVE